MRRSAVRCGMIIIIVWPRNMNYLIKNNQVCKKSISLSAFLLSGTPLKTRQLIWNSQFIGDDIQLVPANNPMGVGKIPT